MNKTGGDVADMKQNKKYLNATYNIHAKVQQQDKTKTNKNVPVSLVWP